MSLDLKVFSLVCLVGCGDALVGDTYRGQPLLVLEGPIEVPDGWAFLSGADCEGAYFECYDLCDTDAACARCDEAFEGCLAETSAESRTQDFRLGLFWARPSEGAGSVQQFGLVTSGFPARYYLSIYGPPPGHVVRAASDEGHYALGLVLVYLDLERDGQYTAGRDPIVGGADQQALLYSPAGMQDALLGAWGAGYHRLRLAPFCGDPPRQDEGPTVITLSTAVLDGLVFDPDCDGLLDDFDICLDQGTLDHVCRGADPGLCDLCQSVQ